MRIWPCLSAGEATKGQRRHLAGVECCILSVCVFFDTSVYDTKHRSSFFFIINSIQRAMPSGLDYRHRLCVYPDLNIKGDQLFLRHFDFMVSKIDSSKFRDRESFCSMPIQDRARRFCVTIHCRSFSNIHTTSDPGPSSSLSTIVFERPLTCLPPPSPPARYIPYRF